jgi:hypothetical protein
MHFIRRSHLYFGLFLAPWAVVYGVSAFLFNHPTAFSDQTATHFGRDATIGTPLDGMPTPSETAAAVVAKLNESQQPNTPYVLAGEAKYNRELAFATVRCDAENLSIAIDLKAGTGTVRVLPIRERKQVETAPFVVGVGRAAVRGASANGRGVAGRQDAIQFDNPMHERVKTAVPIVLERTGFAGGKVTVTSVPDLVFPIEADGRLWTATYSPLTGAVVGRIADIRTDGALSWRRFLLLLHVAHGYPNEANARWFWAVIVDAMAVVMCFWAGSGLFMWWQIKATRRLGLVVLFASAIATTALGIGMHAALTP